MSKTTPKPEKPVGHNATSATLDDIGFVEAILHAILWDGYNLLSSYKLADYLRDRATISKRLSCEGLGYACVVLPKFFDCLLQVLEGGEPSFPGHKIRFNDCPAFLSGLLVRVLGHEDDDTVALDVIYSICHAFKKLKGPYHPAVLRRQARDFVDTDVEVGMIDYTSEPLTPIIGRAKKFVNTLFEGVDEDVAMKPCPGPGATNTPTKQYERYEPHALYSQLEDQFPADEWFYAHPWDVVNRAREYLSLPKLSFPTSRFKFVHKYRSKPRGICIEENETQWCQQALKGFLYKHVENHSMTRGRINFTYQSVNQRLALESSHDMSFATIDMSAASDRVSRELVHRLFWDTSLFSMLDAVSTRVIVLPKEVQSVANEIYVNKFAPMGSAVCFPIMAIVHFALIKAIVQLSSIENATEVSKHIYVYGDDIILPREAVQAVYDYLPLFGMKINEGKSFHSSYFRESCGVHAYKGVDITPVYNNYTLTKTHGRTDTTRLLSAVAKEHGYFLKGFHTTARVVREHVRKVHGQLPFVKPDSPLLGWKREGFDFSSMQSWCSKKRRYNWDEQSFYYRLRCVEPRFKGPRAFGVEDSRALLRWHLKPPKDQDAATFMCSPEDHKISWRWVSEHALG